MPRENKGPYLVKNRQGIYEIHFTNNGRSVVRSTRTGDSSVAQTVLAHFVLLDRTTEPKLNTPSIAQLLTHYYDARNQDLASPQTLQHLTDNLMVYFGTMLPIDVTDRVMDGYFKFRRAGRAGQLRTNGQVVERQARKAGNGTLRREVGVLKAAINYGVTDRQLDPSEVPLDPRTGKMRIKVPPEPPARQRVLTPAEYEALQVACELTPRLRLYCALGMETAARPAAIIELRWGQVDLAHGLINLNPPGRIQTKKHRPIVAISDTLRAALESEIARLAAEAQEAPRTAAIRRRPVPDPDKTVLGSAASIKHTFRLAAKRAGLKGVTPYTLRHTRVTWLLRSGATMWDVAQLIGDRVETVEKYYAHAAPEYLHETVNRRAPRRQSVARPTVPANSTPGDSAPPAIQWGAWKNPALRSG